MKNSNIKSTFKLILVGTLSLLFSNANAAIIDTQNITISGVGTYTSASNFSYCPSYCQGFSYSSDGGEGSITSSTEHNSTAHAKAYSSFVPGSFLPLLRVEASSDKQKSGRATAFSIQNYTYTGTGTKSVDINVNLHGSVGDNPEGDANNSLSAHIAIISGTSIDWYTSFSTLVTEIAFPIQPPTSLFIDDGNDINVSDTISFEVNAGESFFIVSNMFAYTKNGFSNAWNTLSMDFKNGSNLQAALQVATPQPPTGVPEPETILLFGLGLMGVFLKTRKS